MRHTAYRIPNPRRRSWAPPILLAAMMAIPGLNPVGAGEVKCTNVTPFAAYNKAIQKGWNFRCSGKNALVLPVYPAELRCVGHDGARNTATASFFEKGSTIRTMGHLNNDWKIKDFTVTPQHSRNGLSPGRDKAAVWFSSSQGGSTITLKLRSLTFVKEGGDCSKILQEAF